MAHELGNLTTDMGMIMGQRMTYYANNPCMLIDKDLGTVLKIGDSVTNPLEDYFKTAVNAYAEAGMQDMANAMVLINFDRYATLDIDEICTLMNYCMNSIGQQKMAQLLNCDETELKSELKRLAEMGW